MSFLTYHKIILKVKYLNLLVILENGTGRIGNQFSLIVKPVILLLKFY